MLKQIWNNLFPKIIFATKEYFEKYYDVITITYSNNTVEKFQGKGTVWYRIPMFTRCGTFKEGKLCEISKYIERYGNPYPIAHKK